MPAHAEIISKQIHDLSKLSPMCNPYQYFQLKTGWDEEGKRAEKQQMTSVNSFKHLTQISKYTNSVNKWELSHWCY